MHVHDLVDYVSQEASWAGRNAAAYIKKLENHAVETESEKQKIHIKPESGVRYTVPKMIRPDRISDHLVLRFRVGDVYRDAWIRVYFDRELILEKRKKVMAPGEME